MTAPKHTFATRRFHIGETQFAKGDDLSNLPQLADLQHARLAGPKNGQIDDDAVVTSEAPPASVPAKAPAKA